MSKQIKLKFKKLLKNAEFVHADLEYHEELMPDAKQEFFAEAQKIMDGLPADVQQQFKDKRDQKIINESLDENEDTEDVEDESEETDLAITEDETDGAAADDQDETGGPVNRESSLKKLYRKIAAETHPDKSTAKGLDGAGSKIAENIFKRAKEAYKDKNWYVLYSIALDLQLDVEDPKKEHLEWLQEDIKNGKSKVEHMAQLIVWVWYTGDEESKRFALQNYFQQVYDYTINI
jgi:DnaJ-domain-containing protein 1